MKTNGNFYYGRACKKHPELKGKRYLGNSTCAQCNKDYSKERHAQRTMTVAQEMTTLRSRVRELESEVEALRKDAGRYQWVLKNASLILDKKTAYQAETGFIKMDNMPAKSESHTAVTWAMSKESANGQAT